MVGSLSYLPENCFETIIEDTEVNCWISKIAKHSVLVLRQIFFPLLIFLFCGCEHVYFYRTSMVIYVNLCMLDMLGSVRIVIVCRKKIIILSFIIDYILATF